MSPDADDRLSWRVHVASLAGGLVFLLYVNRAQWFYGDDWDFLDRRGVFGAHLGLFFPHNEHWSTLPILLYRGVFGLIGIRHYLPYAALGITFHLLAAHMLWRIMRRTGSNALVATGVAAVFVVLGAGYENLLWAFQVTFIASLAFGLAHIWVIQVRPDVKGAVVGSCPPLACCARACRSCWCSRQPSPRGSAPGGASLSPPSSCRPRCSSSGWR